MRWDPAIRASKHLINEGWIGVPVLAALEVNYWENWKSWPWLTVAERLTILIDAIHPLYSFRMLFGEPTRVYCVKGRSPDQKERGETHAVISLEFPEGPNGLILDCSTNPTNDHFATFRFDGTEGSIKGTLGIWYNYPFGAADTLNFSSKTKSPGLWISAELEDRWVPDAFIGPMGALMKAIHEEAEPENSGREHLKTLQVIEAAYRSAAEKRPVSPQEISVDLDT
ncbi:MAG: Gfo/Idh/MocA family oxidoreductase [Acidobacteria bacterium]|nr:Gfo/Idh/MocA family oxidoreductase [Acidobacteriota bacterium]MCI0718825.1 Gfo/Idh/MocA family oxidoreductase [Acidobacteriota bacterium]